MGRTYCTISGLAVGFWVNVQNSAISRGRYILRNGALRNEDYDKTTKTTILHGYSRKKGVGNLFAIQDKIPLIQQDIN